MGLSTGDGRAKEPGREGATTLTEVSKVRAAE